MYRLLLVSHVLGAVLAVGPAFTYGAWLALGRRAGEAEEAFAFRGVLWLDRHLVTPAFLWQLVSGLLLVLVYRVASFREAWLAASLALYGAVALLAVLVVAPGARRAREALQTAGVRAPAYLAHRRRMRALTPLVSGATLAILVLMVLRPG